jgi:hypothetical protein
VAPYSCFVSWMSWEYQAGEWFSWPRFFQNSLQEIAGGNTLKYATTTSFYLLTYLLTYSMVQDIFEKLIVTQLVEKYPALFMEPEGSLPCSQKPTIGPYPEPVQVLGALKHFLTINFLR